VKNRAVTCSKTKVSRIRESWSRSDSQLDYDL
jgi:hypothetical protein